MARLSIITCLTALGLVQCATSPQLERHLTVREGGITAVSLQQGATRLTLINHSGVTAEQADSARRNDPNLKVIPDSHVQELLDLLGGRGFFDIAGPSTETNSPAWIMVEHDKQPYLAASSFQTQEQLTAWTECFNVIFSVYNANYDFTTSSMSAGDLERESNQLNRSTQATRAKTIKKR